MPTQYSNKNMSEGQSKKLPNQKNAAKIYKKNQENEEFLQNEESEEEEEMDSKTSDLMARLLKNYSENQSETTKDLPVLEIEKIQKKLTERIRTANDDSSQICLICLECVGRDEPVWSCRFCFELYHLVCTQKWANQSLQLCEMREDNSQAIWCCPKCRHEYSSIEKPKKYTCYCGKVVNPKSNLWNAAHSCGETCERKLACEHSCLLLCHPGQCPVCPKVVRVKCFCGKSPSVARRCGQKGWSCGKCCGQTLDCNVHSCSSLCHGGKCQPCDKKSVRKCRCGRKSEERSCADANWSCGEVCGQILECGRHECEEICHTGPCLPCVRAGSNACPCGKHLYQEAECRDGLPCCGDTCGKLLDCGVHECFERCHRGPCLPCTQDRQKRCRCGQKSKLVPCNKEYVCDSKCRNKRQCGRHACSRRCCDGECPPCEAACGRTLKCGTHKCPAPCHAGLCYPCPEIVEVTCQCGHAKIRVPCGREKNVKPPICKRRCQIPPDCHHSMREPHRCHLPPCPPCRQICAKTYSKCGHRCRAPCHSAVLVNTNLPKEKPATPWERPKPKIEQIMLQCPPCRTQVPVQCLGDHETGMFPCCEVRPYSCGRKCGKILACGNHQCSKICHDIRGVDECEECESMCDSPRPGGCRHQCPKACHPAPCPPCRQMVKEECHCGLNPKYVPCKEWSALSPEKRLEQLCCGNQCPKLMDCGHRCLKLCHRGVCSDRKECKKRIRITCQCGRIKDKKMCYAIKLPAKTAALTSGDSGLVESMARKILDCDAECKKQLDQTRGNLESKNEEKTLGQSDNSNWIQESSSRRTRKKKDRKRSLESDESFWELNKWRIVGTVVFSIIVALWAVYRFSNN